LVQPSEPVAQSFRREIAEPAPAAAAAVPTAEEAAAEEKSARRRSTVREKVSFTSSPAPDTAPAMPAATDHPAAAAEADPADDQPQGRLVVAPLRRRRIGRILDDQTKTPGSAGRFWFSDRVRL
jgi:ribonuclease E